MKDEMKDMIVTPSFFDMFAQVEKGSVNSALYAKRVEHDFKKREATKVRRNLDHLAHNYHLRSGGALNVEDARSMVNNLELDEAECAVKAHERVFKGAERLASREAKLQQRRACWEAREQAQRVREE